MEDEFQEKKPDKSYKVALIAKTIFNNKKFPQYNIIRNNSGYFEIYNNKWIPYNADRVFEFIAMTYNPDYQDEWTSGDIEEGTDALMNSIKKVDLGGSNLPDKNKSLYTKNREIYMRSN